MSDWQPIETAPKDGTVIRLRNPEMAKAKWTVRGRWCEFHSAVTGKVYTNWCSDYTNDDPLFTTPRGRLICPTEWKPDAEPIHPDRESA